MRPPHAGLNISNAGVGLRGPVVTVDDVRAVVRHLPRSYEVLVRGRIKFRVGRIVYLDFSRDQSIMGFAFPREWRPVLVSAEPEKFMLPIESELRYNWVRVRLAAIDAAEMRDLVLDAWAMVVPKRVAAAQGGLQFVDAPAVRLLDAGLAAGPRRVPPRGLDAR
jgi:hypothetical protein